MILPCFHAIYITGTRFILSLDCEVAWVWHTNTEENKSFTDWTFRFCYTRF